MSRHCRTVGPHRPRVPEVALQRAITDWLTIAGVLHTVTDAALIVGEDESGAKTLTSSKVTRSWPDVTAVLPGSGKALCIECKSESGRYMEGQREMLDRLAAAGAVVVTARRLRDVVDAIERELGAEIDLPELWRLRRAVCAYRTGVGGR